jgi:hypothetical protein
VTEGKNGEVKVEAPGVRLLRKGIEWEIRFRRRKTEMETEKGDQNEMMRSEEL